MVRHILRDNAATEMKMTHIYEELRFRFRASTTLVTLALVSCALSWGILIAAHVDRAGDNAFGALVLATFATPLVALIAAASAIRTVDFVPPWQWKVELGLAIVLFLIGLGAVVALFVPLS